jgi:hypothetical protein
MLYLTPWSKNYLDSNLSRKTCQMKNMAWEVIFATFIGNKNTEVKRSDEWVRCRNCKKWRHEECTDLSGTDQHHVESVFVHRDHEMDSQHNCVP